MLLGKGELVRLEDLPQQLREEMPLVVEAAAGASLKSAMRNPERQIIIEMLERNHWNRQATADATDAGAR